MKYKQIKEKEIEAQFAKKQRVEDLESEKKKAEDLQKEKLRIENLEADKIEKFKVKENQLAIAEKKLKEEE